MVKRLLEGAMEEEMREQLRAGRYRRSLLGRGCPNGYRQRHLLTELGLVADLRVPKEREGQFHPTVISYYQWRQDEVNRLAREMFLSGVSPRKVKAVVEPLLGEGISPQRVSRITPSLETEVRRFPQRLLKEGYQYLSRDGITLWVKGAPGLRDA